MDAGARRRNCYRPEADIRRPMRLKYPDKKRGLSLISAPKSGEGEEHHADDHESVAGVVQRARRLLANAPAGLQERGEGGKRSAEDGERDDDAFGEEDIHQARLARAVPS